MKHYDKRFNQTVHLVDTVNQAGSEGITYSAILMHCH